MSIISAPKGTADILPSESYKWHYLEDKIRRLCDCYGFSEIRTPVFEHTEVFVRGVGDTTDVVTKEMYTFEDKGGRSITLRPEGTAGIVRSFLENGLFNDPLPAKLYYLINCFRYEKPQKGRLRQFSQFGIEMFGATAPSADAMVISLPYNLLKSLGIETTLYINSIGCPECRAKYRTALIEYFEDKKDRLCATCLERLEKNPMRILDCKSEICGELSKDAPKITDYLCEECDTHFASVRELLTGMGIEYEVDPGIVRGLDYYNRTVFEFVSNAIGAQGTVCGGGRYDGMTEQLGGGNYAGIGFAMGLERLMLLLPDDIERPTTDLYIAPMGERAKKEAAAIAQRLILDGASVEYDIMDRSLKAQMKYANKKGARLTMVVGDNELDTGVCNIKNMETGEQTEIKLSELGKKQIEEIK
ncbi:MAG: histidine--tRNA ligase [Clostridia bacterium]|nr:histidine--tRNA ligase [Clostridia bacterium]